LAEGKINSDWGICKDFPKETGVKLSLKEWVEFE
jgi:hypothetical protein